MRYFDASPYRGNALKWFSILTILAICMMLTSAPPWVAFAQEQQQGQAQKPTAAQIETQAQQQLKEITLIPVSLVSPIERAEKDGTALRLSLKDVTKLALQNNLNIAIADTQEDLKQQAVISAHAAYDPTLSISGNTRRANQAPTQQTQQATSGYITTTDTASWNFSITQQIPTGGNVSLSWNTSRSDSNVADNLTNPSYGATASLNLRQPLWKNLKVDSLRNSIKIANLDLKANDSSFKQSVTQTVAQIQKAYWSLVSSIYSYRNAVGSVLLARTSAENAKKKVDIGTAAPIEYTQSLASQASREVNVISAEERILQAENTLKNLISKDRSADIWGQTIVPTDTPEVEEYKVDLNQATAVALKNSTQLETDDMSLQKQDLSYALTRENKKWQVDLTANIGSSGTGGNQGFRNGVPVLAPEFVGGLFTGYKTIFTGGTYNWQVGFSVSIPLRGRSVETQLATARINRQNLVMQRTQHEQQIIVDIKNYVQALTTAKRQLDTAAISRQLAETQLDAENKRLAAGLSQQFQVLQAQDTLSSAQSSELSSKINYKTAIINLQQAMNTLLTESNINLATDLNKSKVTTFK
jgi:outer membrane protein TolC